MVAVDAVLKIVEAPGDVVQYHGTDTMVQGVSTIVGTLSSFVAAAPPAAFSAARHCTHIVARGLYDDPRAAEAASTLLRTSCTPIDACATTTVRLR